MWARHRPLSTAENGQRTPPEPAWQLTCGINLWGRVRGRIMPTLSEAPHGGEELEMKVCLGLVVLGLVLGDIRRRGARPDGDVLPDGRPADVHGPRGRVDRARGDGRRARRRGRNERNSGGFGATASAGSIGLPGQLLYVEVGGNGGFGSGPSPGAGGFNGGGAGGSGAGGGGGASDVRTSPAGTDTSLGSRQVVAGGGGGGTEGSGGGTRERTAERQVTETPRLGRERSNRPRRRRAGDADRHICRQRGHVRHRWRGRTRD